MGSLLREGKFLQEMRQKNLQSYRIQEKTFDKHTTMAYKRGGIEKLDIEIERYYHPENFELTDKDIDVKGNASEFHKLICSGCELCYGDIHL